MKKSREPYQSIQIGGLKLDFHLASTRKTPFINTDCSLLVHFSKAPLKNGEKIKIANDVTTMVQDALANVFCRYSRPFRLKPVENDNFLIKHLKTSEIDSKINTTKQLLEIQIARQNTGNPNISYTEVKSYFTGSQPK